MPRLPYKSRPLGSAHLLGGPGGTQLGSWGLLVSRGQGTTTITPAACPQMTKT